MATQAERERHARNYQANRTERLAKQKQYYHDHRNAELARTKAWRARNRLRSNEHQRRFMTQRRKYLHELKSVPCADCGGVFPPVCMDFDHRDGEEKLFCIAHISKWTKATIAAELAKCDVICSNCHRVRTSQRRTRQQEQVAA